MRVFEETRALSIVFAHNNPLGRPIAAKWKHTADSSVSGTVAFDYLVDATGREGIMAQKYLKHRKINASLRNVACWGYWRGAGVYGIGTSRENAPWFEALTGPPPHSQCIFIHANPPRPQMSRGGTGSSRCTTGRRPSASS